MPRVELWMTIFAGLAGGLAGVLWGELVTGPWLARHGGLDAGTSRTETAARVLGAAALRAFAGGALGFLFWLGWALISVVNAPWYVPGLLFGLLTWAGIAAPLLLGAALRLQGFNRVALVLAIEWLVTCLAVGLFCTFAWHRYT